MNKKALSERDICTKFITPSLVNQQPQAASPKDPMPSGSLALAAAPIIEAVLDIDCDMPPGFDLASKEPAGVAALGDDYPVVHRQFMQQHIIQPEPQDPAKMAIRPQGHSLQALQFLQSDTRQLVQLRAQGFSFNRLAPYTSLDAYLPEIERTWQIFVTLAAPVQIRSTRLRYINRILIPAEGGNANLDEYLAVGPHLPGGTGLTFTGFLNQHTAVEKATGNQVNIILTTQPLEAEAIPLIFDITAASLTPIEVADWPRLLAQVQMLRELKNNVFRNTLTERCLSLFQQSRDS